MRWDCTLATRAVRRCSLPRLVMWPWYVALPELWVEGTRPAYETRRSELGNRDMSPISDTMSMAVYGPIPGIVRSSRGVSSGHRSIWSRMVRSTLPMQASMASIMSRQSSMR